MCEKIGMRAFLENDNNYSEPNYWLPHSDYSRYHIAWQTDQLYFLGSQQRTKSQTWDLERPYRPSHAVGI